MATLRHLNANSTLELRPYRVSDEGPPRFLLADVRVEDGAREVLRDTISATEEDFAQIIRLHRELCQGVRPAFAIKVVNEDFEVVGEVVPPERLLVGFWLGEVSDLNRGFRILATTDEVMSFAQDLESEVSSVKPPATLP